MQSELPTKNRRVSNLVRKVEQIGVRAARLFQLDQKFTRGKFSKIWNCLEVHRIESLCTQWTTFVKRRQPATEVWLSYRADWIAKVGTKSTAREGRIQSNQRLDYSWVRCKDAQDHLRNFKNRKWKPGKTKRWLQIRIEQSLTCLRQVNSGVEVIVRQFGKQFEACRTRKRWPEILYAEAAPKYPRSV